MLNIYNQIPGFVEWCTRNHVTLINDANAKYYYTLFQQDKKCSARNCINCPGEFIGYESEADIAIGRIIPKRCIIITQERQRKESEALKKKLKVPVKYERMTWDNLNISPISKTNLMDYVRRYPDNKPNGLYIYSTDTQSIKTATLWVLIQDLVNQLRLTSLVIQSTTILLSRAREDAFSDDGINETLKSAISCDLLALDDFGMEKQTAWSSEKLYTILTERSNKNRPTILVSCVEPNPVLWQSPFEASIIGKITESSVCVDLDAKEQK